MGFRLSRRFGPVRASAFDHGHSQFGAYRYDEAHDVLDAYQPNWIARIAVVAITLTPAWIAHAFDQPVFFVALGFAAAVGLITWAVRTELPYATGGRNFIAWCGAVVAGIVLAAMFGALVNAVVTSAAAQDGEQIPTYSSESYCKNVGALLGDNQKVISGCRSSEQEARANIERVWPATPPTVKSDCIRQVAVAGTSSNYQGLGGCLAMRVGNLWYEGKVKIRGAE